MLDATALDVIFRAARTHRAWDGRPVADATLHEIYELMKWGPTTSNTCPARFVFVKSPEAKERLRPALDAGNVVQTMNAPVTAIIAFDLEFYEKMPKLMPNTNARSWFVDEPEAESAHHGAAQRFAAGRLPHHRCARDRARLRSDVRLRQRQSGRGILRRHSRPVQLSVQSRLWRPVEAPSARTAAVVRRGLLDRLCPYGDR